MTFQRGGYVPIYREIVRKAASLYGPEGAALISVLHADAVWEAAAQIPSRVGLIFLIEGQALASADGLSKRFGGTISPDRIRTLLRHFEANKWIKTEKAREQRRSPMIVTLLCWPRHEDGE